MFLLPVLPRVPIFLLALWLGHSEAFFLFLFVFSPFLLLPPLLHSHASSLLGFASQDLWFCSLQQREFWVLPLKSLSATKRSGHENHSPTATERSLWGLWYAARFIFLPVWVLTQPISRKNFANLRKSYQEKSYLSVTIHNGKEEWEDCSYSVV